MLFGGGPLESRAREEPGAKSEGKLSADTTLAKYTRTLLSSNDYLRDESEFTLSTLLLKERSFE